jgi:pilus assembly protein CpaE
MNGAAAQSISAETPLPDVPRLAAFIDDSLSARTLGAVFAARSLDAPAVSEGGSTAALHNLDTDDPPDILVVDTGDSTSPAAEISVLRSMLPDGVRVVAIGSERGVGTYRDMMAAGVTDYLEKPVSREDLDDAIFGHEPSPSRRKLRPPQGGAETERQFVFIGARGGVGTTTAAVNTAWLMAKRSQQSSLLLDLDLQFGTTLLALNLEPSPALVQVLREPDRLDDVMLRQAVYDVGRHLAVLAAEEPVDMSPAVQPSAPVVLMRQIRSQFHNVFIDLPGARLEEHEAYLADATDIVLVSDVSLACVRDTIRMLERIERMVPEARVHVLVGGISDQRKAPMTVRQFEESIGTKVAAVIPYDPEPSGEASAAGRPVVSFRKGSRVAKAYNEFVQRFLPSPEKAGWRFLRGWRKEAG